MIDLEKAKELAEKLLKTECFSKVDGDKIVISKIDDTKVYD